MGKLLFFMVIMASQMSIWNKTFEYTNYVTTLNIKNKRHSFIKDTMACFMV